MEPLLTHSEAAKFLSISPQTLTRLGDAGEIARYRIGNQWRYKRADMDAYLERQKDAAKVAA
jgi:excisionase family DNA binding protein